MIKVEKLVKKFPNVTAVDNASFVARDGEITTLLGANGSGKSTTMRAIAGVIKVDDGSAHVDDVHVGKSPNKARRRLGVFPDQFGLYRRLKAREEIAYFAGFHGLKGQKLNDAMDEVVSILNMEDIIDRYTEGFSQGQRMKVALARTLIHKPQNLMLDEPARGLDVMNIRLLRSILQDRRNNGQCILMSSHVMAEVHELSDRVVVIHQGNIIADSTPGALISQTGADSLENAFVSLINEAG